MRKRLHSVDERAQERVNALVALFDQTTIKQSFSAPFHDVDTALRVVVDDPRQSYGARITPYDGIESACGAVVVLPTEDEARINVLGITNRTTLIHVHPGPMAAANTVFSPEAQQCIGELLQAVRSHITTPD